mgnify:CR=1 FL=1
MKRSIKTSLFAVVAISIMALGSFAFARDNNRDHDRRDRNDRNRNYHRYDWGRKYNQNVNQTFYVVDESGNVLLLTLVRDRFGNTYFVDQNGSVYLTNFDQSGRRYYDRKNDHHRFYDRDHSRR